MNLETIKNGLSNPKSKAELVNFIEKNLKSLESFFIGLTKEEIENLKFQIKDICESFIRSSYFKSNKKESSFIDLLTLFAGFFERTGFYGTISLINANLPHDSSIFYRLRAVFEFLKIGHLDEYISKFDRILRCLKKAQDNSDLDYTGQVVDDIIQYYRKGSAGLKNQDSRLKEFKALFKSDENIQKYPFLNHVRIAECLYGLDESEIELKPISKRIFLPSGLAQQIFQNLILTPIKQENYLSRYDSSEIRGSILKYGRADFTQAYADLTPYDRVQLYCYFNMRKHFFTSYAIYECIYDLLESNTKEFSNFTFIDLGCGPLTCGLALASLYYDKKDKPLSLDYIGIDISKDMLKKAGEFSQTKLFKSNSQFYLCESWKEDKILEYIHPNKKIVVNASYLFASSSLEVNSLVDFIITLTRITKKILFIFQNPDRSDRNKKYKSFKNGINHKIRKNGSSRIYYKNKPSRYEPSYEVINFEILNIYKLDH